MPGGTPRTPASCQRRRIGVMGWCCEDGPFPRRAPGQRCRLTIALYLCRAASRRSWRQAMLLALLSGLLGAVALGAIAGAPHVHRLWSLSDGEQCQRRIRERGREAAHWDRPQVVIRALPDRSEEHTSELQSPCNI